MIIDWRQLKVGQHVRLKCGCEGFVTRIYDDRSKNEYEQGFYVAYTRGLTCGSPKDLERHYRDGYGPYCNLFNGFLATNAMPAKEIPVPGWWEEISKLPHFRYRALTWDPNIQNFARPGVSFASKEVEELLKKQQELARELISCNAVDYAELERHVEKQRMNALSAEDEEMPSRVILTDEELKELGLNSKNIKNIRRRSDCECDGGAFPGILFPCGHDGNFDYAWVERCDSCDLFESDEEACFFVARILDRKIAFAKFDPAYRARPYIVDLSFEEAQRIEEAVRINKVHPRFADRVVMSARRKKLEEE